MKSTMVVEQTNFGNWIAFGEYLGVPYFASCLSRADTMAKAAEQKVSIFDKQLTPAHDYFVEVQI